MAAPALHVMFNPSGRGSLSEALRKIGSSDRVIACHDTLAFGPIDPPEAQMRARWVEEELGVSGWDEVTVLTQSFMQEALSADANPIGWFSLRDTQSFTGFLEWVWCLGDAPCRIVEVSNLLLRPPNGKPHFVLTPSLILPDEFVENGLLDGAQPLSSEARAEFRALWSGLKAENAPLRVFADGNLVSATLEVFDGLILSHIESSWRKMARTVGEVLGEWMDDYYQQGDIFLASRIRALAEAGIIEWRGELYEMRNCEIRLPQCG